MNIVYQYTLNGVVKLSGIGLHTKQFVNVKFKPACENTGIVFYRTDKICKIPALVSNVQKCNYATVLKYKCVIVSTIEHVLFAIFSLKIDNIIIELDGEEIPILDGSAYPFIRIFKLVGLRVQNSLKKFIKIKKRVSVLYGDRFVELLPSDKLSFFVKLNFNDINLCLYNSFMRVNFGCGIIDISRSKTFGFLGNYSEFKSSNLIKGANFKNILIFDNMFLLNENYYNSDLVMVKHKILDIFGDLSLLGKGIFGIYRACKPGHILNNILLNKLISDNKSYEIVRYIK